MLRMGAPCQAAHVLVLLGGFRMRILVIEDEERLSSTLSDMLEEAGFSVDCSYDGEDGFLLAKSGIYDAVVLDVMLPGMDGCQIVETLRENGIMTPVLMLTARSELKDRVRGLNAGADYYLTKPFENLEFFACLHAVLRRKSDILPDSYLFEDLILTPSSSELSCGGASVALSAKELELMRLLIQNSSQFLSKEMLLLRVWGYDSNVNSNSVEAYISFLRKKLNLLKSRVRIHVVRNIGYRLEVLKL